MWKDQLSKCSHGAWGEESTILISSLFMKIERKKRGKVCNALVTFVNLTVVNDHGSSDRISSVDSVTYPYAATNRNFKRVIPPRKGLLRLAHSSPFSRFLVNLSKEGISAKRSIPWGFPRDRQRETNSRGWTGSLTWFNSCIIKFIYQHNPCVVFLL
jgi:hypothetical protein